MVEKRVRSHVPFVIWFEGAGTNLQISIQAQLLALCCLFDNISLVELQLVINIELYGFLKRWEIFKLYCRCFCFCLCITIIN